MNSNTGFSIQIPLKYCIDIVVVFHHPLLEHSSDNSPFLCLVNSSLFQLKILSLFLRASFSLINNMCRATFACELTINILYLFQRVLIIIQPFLHDRLNPTTLRMASDFMHNEFLPYSMMDADVN